VVTLGIVTYHARNDQLYDELIRRAASIERSLGIPDGTFANRPREWFLIGPKWAHWKVSHGVGIATIYAATIAFWLVACLGPIKSKLGSAELMGLGIAAAIATLLIALAIKWYREALWNGIKKNIQCAARELDGKEFGAVVENKQLADICGEILGDTAALRKRAEFYAERDPGELGFYMLADCDKRRVSHMLALLTDLTPECIYDAVTNR
jgi:hypothetical protein